MTDQGTTLATWEKMTDTQKGYRHPVIVFNGEKYYLNNEKERRAGELARRITQLADYGDVVEAKTVSQDFERYQMFIPGTKLKDYSMPWWNPLTDWNHTAQVLKRCSELGMSWDLPITQIADQGEICRKIYLEYHAK